MLYPSLKTVEELETNIENAFSILKDPERSKATDQGYRVVYVAMDQYKLHVERELSRR